MRCVKVATDQLDKVLRLLRNEFPASKPLWQTAKDIHEGKVKANLYVDDWGKFSTVISQEFSPRMSDVSDIKIYTKKKEKVMDMINALKVLEQNGYQAIQCFTKLEEEREKISKYFQKVISQHPAVKNEKLLSLLELDLYDSHTGKSQAPPGYVIRDLQLEHAELITKHWNLHPIPFSNKLHYVRELISKFDTVGIYTVQDSSKPVSWLLRTNGGVLGIGYTFPQHRKKELFGISITELTNRIDPKGDIVVGGTTVPTKAPVTKIGRNIHITLYPKKTSYEQCNNVTLH